MISWPWLIGAFVLGWLASAWRWSTHSDEALDRILETMRTAKTAILQQQDTIHRTAECMTAVAEMFDAAVKRAQQMRGESEQWKQDDPSAN